MGEKNTEPEEVKPEKMNAEDLPETKAMQDKFTRGFFHSQKEEESGYYLLHSQTGKYTMLFPTEAAIGEQSYTKKQDDYEFIFWGMADEENGTESSGDITYNSQDKASNIEHYLKNITDTLSGIEGFEKKVLDGKVAYVAPFEKKYPEKNKVVFGQAAYIHPASGESGIEIYYDTSCSEKSTDCGTVKKDQEEKVDKILSSITFINKNESE